MEIVVHLGCLCKKAMFDGEKVQDKGYPLPSTIPWIAETSRGSVSTRSGNPSSQNRPLYKPLAMIEPTETHLFVNEHQDPQTMRRTHTKLYQSSSVVIAGRVLQSLLTLVAIL